MSYYIHAHMSHSRIYWIHLSRPPISCYISGLLSSSFSLLLSRFNNLDASISFPLCLLHNLLKCLIYSKNIRSIWPFQEIYLLCLSEGAALFLFFFHHWRTRTGSPQALKPIPHSLVYRLAAAIFHRAKLSWEHLLSPSEPHYHYLILIDVCCVVHSWYLDIGEWFQSTSTMVPWIFKKIFTFTLA